MEDIVDLYESWRHARELLGETCWRAKKIYGASENTWADMEVFRKRLWALRTLIEEAMPDSVKNSIKEEREWLESMADNS